MVKELKFSELCRCSRTKYCKIFMFRETKCRGADFGHCLWSLLENHF
jgi:hypothetical protein